MIHKILDNKLVLFLLIFVITYTLINNMNHLSSYADFPTEINKIENCKNEKLIDKAISNSNGKNINNNVNVTSLNPLEKFHHIKKFDSNGNFITMWGSKGSKEGQFIEDHGIAVDKSEYVHVVDTRNVRIQKFDSNGNFITMWGSLGCKDDHF